MKIYCQKCGHPSEYTTYKPKFCQACGTPMGTLTAANTEYIATDEGVKPVIEEERVQSHIPQNDERPPECVPYINKLDVFIDASDTKPRSVKFEDALGSKNKDEEEYKRGLDPEIDSEAFKEQFQKEAGTLRRPNSDGTQEKS